MRSYCMRLCNPVNLKQNSGVVSYHLNGRNCLDLYLLLQDKILVWSRVPSYAIVN